MHPSVAVQTQPLVAPAFDGTATLPRIRDWARAQTRLRERPALVELEPDFFRTALGGRYVRQLAALGLSPERASARLEASDAGFTAVLRLQTGERVLEDRWDVEVDANGVVRDGASDHQTAYWRFDSGAMSSFFDGLLAGL